MATSMAAAISRSIIALRSSSQSFLTLRSAPPLRSLSKRFMSSSFRQPHPFPGQFRQAIPLSWRLNQVRFRVNQAGGSGYSPLNSGSNFSDRPPTEMAPLFPGCDYQHWLIVIDKPGGEGATKQQMIDCYIHTLAQILGSEEEAKKKIYNVSCERYFGFGCEIDEETANKLESVPGVLFVLPDSYVDPEYKDYGAELFVNGEIVQRSPDRQRRVEPQPQTGRDRPKYNDRTRYVRRRENMR